MNRYSLVFALLVASSFAVHPNHAGEAAPGISGASQENHPKKQGINGAQPIKNASSGMPQIPASQDVVRLINAFLAKALAPATAQGSVQVLFATVPHPTETQLAAAFDHNLDALQDGLRESDYLFDSSWIPWDVRRARDDFDDDVKEKIAQQDQDDTPGVLLFRRNRPGEDPYAHGLIVILLSEKPTEGIAYSQAVQAANILQQCKLADWQAAAGKVQHPDVLRILGPTFSGSFASLVPVVKYLHDKDSAAEIIIRSGGVTGGKDAENAAQDLAVRLPQTGVDIGSVHHDYSEWIKISQSALSGMGICPGHTAILSEEESLFGGLADSYADSTAVECGAEKKTRQWILGFPRDISSLRAGYEEQGLLDAGSTAQPWKRFLNLKSDVPNGGDTIRSFGGTATTETQEAILFGISHFLRSHGIQAVIISATNEQDRLFLTQFLHKNNSGVRVVVIGATRIFTRGMTAQFSGDLVVDDFPMLPRLHDWTGEKSDRDAHLFADDVAQGTYFAAIDLFWSPKEGKAYKWFPEYSEPDWTSKGKAVQQPPMYVAALGSDATWPIAESPNPLPAPDHPSEQNHAKTPQVEFPFQLFEHDHLSKSQSPVPPESEELHVGRYWKILWLAVALLSLTYGACILYANPIATDFLASFQPTPSWEYWLLKVAIPAAAAGCAFQVLAWSVDIPLDASPDARVWWNVAKAATLLAPLIIAVSAVSKALFRMKLRWNYFMVLPFIPVIAALIFLPFTIVFGLAPYPSPGKISSILSTYREMHWESGLSLVPTYLFFLAAIVVWASQASNGGAALNAARSLPAFPHNEKISAWRARRICVMGRPFPKVARLWIVWGPPAALLFYAHFHFGPFLEITTLESRGMTALVRLITAVLAAMTLFDALQFLFLWDQLRELLRALDREVFKRSFVSIREFDWRSMWSFHGVSFQSRRAINTALIDCLGGLRGAIPAVIPALDSMETLRQKYNNVDLEQVEFGEFAIDAAVFLADLRSAGKTLAEWIEAQDHAGTPVNLPPSVEAIQRALECKCEGRFADEEELLARLPDEQQGAERFLCLMYIAFIQSVVARLHTLLVSVASMFSLLTLGVAIYPFFPLSPLLITGGALLAFIAWAFFHVFSQMDTDPILSRIVNGDDRKLQGNFYTKFAEAMALPVLTAGSALLPGGAGRLLELVSTLFSHGGQ